MSQFRLKRSSGWFAAGDAFKQALTQLSDGAFKLFAFLCLEAERSSATLSFQQASLAQALGKSRRSVGTYLKELQQKGICRVFPSSNQYGTGLLQISAEYWPYQADSPETRVSDTGSAAYLKAVERLYSSVPCIRFPFSQSDRHLARKWFRQQVPLSAVEQAILLGCGRKYVSWLNGQSTEPIGSLYYFVPILEEVLNQYLSSEYCAFNRLQVRRLEKRWLQHQNQSPNLLAQSLRKQNPPERRRDEMMLLI